MNTFLHNVPFDFEKVMHPAAGKMMIPKKKNRSSAIAVIPKATPDSLNIRDMFKKQDNFRRNPAP